MNIVLWLLLSGAAPVERVPIDFHRVGDDGLSLRFYDALDRAIVTNKTLQLAVTDQPARYVLYAEENVEPIDRRSEHFAYRISLRSGPGVESKVIGRFDGRCTRSVRTCASEVIARIVTRVKAL